MVIFTMEFIMTLTNSPPIMGNHTKIYTQFSVTGHFYRCRDKTVEIVCKTPRKICFRNLEKSSWHMYELIDWRSAPKGLLVPAISD